MVPGTSRRLTRPARSDSSLSRSPCRSMLLTSRTSRSMSVDRLGGEEGRPAPGSAPDRLRKAANHGQFQVVTLAQPRRMLDADAPGGSARQESARTRSAGSARSWIQADQHLDRPQQLWRELDLVDDRETVVLYEPGWAILRGPQRGSVIEKAHTTVPGRSSGHLDGHLMVIWTDDHGSPER
jgi:hypothetical protein